MHAGSIARTPLRVIILSTLLCCSFVGARVVAQETFTPPSNEPYSVSYAAGGYDTRGNFLGGTELMNLAAFKGKLYAGVGYWMDRPDFFPGNPDPRSSAQVLVLDSKFGHWRLEKTLSQRNDDGDFLRSRVSAMEVIQFHRFDAAGNVLGPLAEMLAVALDSRKGTVYTQKSPGVWEDTQLPTPTPIRSLTVHYDPTDRTEKIFAGAGGSADWSQDRPIYSGVYDPSAPGRIRWNPKPEATGFEYRVMSMVDCGGSLFAAAKPSIARRNDEKRSWEVIYSYPMTNPFDQTKYASGFRGLTCMAPPGPGGKEALLSGFEGFSGDILRIDPETGAGVVELSTRQFLAQQWGSPPEKRDVIVGYNDVPVVKGDPGGIRLFGLLAFSPKENERNSAWFISRTNGNPPRYELHEVKPLNSPNRRSDAALWSVRAIVASPFPEDQGQVLYLGGYDGHFQPDHNTAWLYRVGIDTALRGYKGTY
jgi:hypothetical protein